MENEKQIKLFLSKLQLKGYSQNTTQGYLRDLTKFFDSINKEYKEVVWQDVNDYFLLMVDKKQPKSIAREMASIRAFFRYLEKEEKIQKDPTTKLETPKMPKRMPKFLTYNEVMSVIDNLDSLRNKTVLYLLFVSGMRISELYGINKDDIDWQNKQIRVVGKGNKERFCPFNETVKSMMEEYLATRIDTNSSLFVERGGNRLSRRAIQRFTKEAGLKSGIKKPVTPHKMRHSLASMLVQNGVEIQKVKEILGHNDIATTQIYACLDNKSVRNAYNSVFDKEE
jgi:integrase/recombinase XerD